jgi:hypothetical protein
VPGRTVAGRQRAAPIGGRIVRAGASRLRELGLFFQGALETEHGRPENTSDIGMSQASSGRHQVPDSSQKPLRTPHFTGRVLLRRFEDHHIVRIQSPTRKLVSRRPDDPQARDRSGLQRAAGRRAQMPQQTRRVPDDDGATEPYPACRSRRG